MTSSIRFPSRRMRVTVVAPYDDSGKELAFSESLSGILKLMISRLSTCSAAALLRTHQAPSGSHVHPPVS